MGRFKDYRCPQCGSVDEYCDDEPTLCRMCGVQMNPVFPAPNVSIPSNRSKQIDRNEALDNAEMSKRQREEDVYQKSVEDTDEHWHRRFVQQEIAEKIKSVEAGEAY